VLRTCPECSTKKLPLGDLDRIVGSNAARLLKL
jgi:hypothetical protein